MKIDVNDECGTGDEEEDEDLADSGILANQ